MWTGHSTLSIEGSAVNFNDYRGMLKRRIERLEELVLGEGGLFMGLKMDQMDFKITEKTFLHDQFDETRPGYSFLTDPNNPFLAMQFNLINAIFKHRHGRLAKGIHKAGDGKASVSWIEKEVSEWLDLHDECAMEICALIHAIGGQPARGVESCLVKLVNTLYRVRGVYAWRPGVLVFVLLYSKTTSMTGMDRVVAHAIPWRLGRLFLMMTALARPLAGILVERSRGPHARSVQETSAFPIRGEEITSAQLSDRLRQWFSQELGVSLGLRAFRHFVIACQRKLMPEAFTVIQQAMAVADTQSGHTSGTATDIYAIDRAEMHLLSPTTVLKSVHCSLRWAQILFPSNMLTDEETNDANDAGKVISSNMNQNAPATINTSEIVKAVTEAFKSNEVIELICERLGQKVASDVVGALEKQRKPTQENTTQVVEAKHLVLLQRFQNNNKATWRSRGQAQAMVHVLAREQSLLIVLPTGGGKSFLFGATPLIETGRTVVVFPYIALMTDQIHEATRRQNQLIASGHQMGRDLRVVDWKVEDNPNQQSSLIGVLVDTFTRTEFQEWLEHEVANRNVNRVVIDEVHTMLTQAHFRPCMRLLQRMTRLGVPVVGLSATLPPTMEEELIGGLGGCNLGVIREGTQRTEIEYHVAQYRNENDAKAAFQKQVHHLENLLEPGEGVLVICRTTEQVQYWASIFNVYGYTGTSNKENRREATTKLLEWTSGKAKTLVGTTAVGTGVNHLHIRAVVHWTPPYGPIDYHQESGRGGRDGKRSVSIIFCWDPQYPKVIESNAGEHVMQHVLDTNECIRLLMSKWLDGPGLAMSCSGGVGYEKCFRCQMRHKQAGEREGTALAGPEEVTNTNQYRRVDELVVWEIGQSKCE
jgi:superfamily II DNA or RNA helicase